MKSRDNFFLTSLRKRLLQKGLACPSCGSPDATRLDRKYLVIEMVRCRHCALMFRTPTTTEAENLSYYQSDYRLGFTTDMPRDAELEKLKTVGFRGTEKDFTGQIELVGRLGGKPGQRLLDFGCSWGYGSWQFRQAGYEVQSFEISQPRCNYARTKLGVSATSRLEEIGDGFDMFFSSHVLEHVPNPAETIKFALTRLRPGGLFIALTPNGSLQRRRVDPGGWHQAWGLNHPNLLDEIFYSSCLKGMPQLYASAPYDVINVEGFARGQSQASPALVSGELLCAALKSK